MFDPGEIEELPIGYTFDLISTSKYAVVNSHSKGSD
jgi:hypothetical protein